MQADDPYSTQETNDIQTRRGTLTVIGGCMFAGKTTYLLKMIREVSANRRLVFKHAMDDRYEADSVVSHDGDSLAAIRVNNPERLLSHINESTRVIAIEEGHFFCAKLAKIVGEIVDRGIDVFVTGLDLDTWGQVLPTMKLLENRCDQYLHKKAHCAKCGREATRTHRLTPIIDGNLIGGPESFEPRCESCWHRPPEPPPIYD